MSTVEDFKIVHNYRNCNAITFYDSEYVWTIVHIKTNIVIMTFCGFKCNKSDTDRDCVEDVHFNSNAVVTVGFDKTISTFKLPTSCEIITKNIPFKKTFYYIRTLEVPDVSLDDTIIETNYLVITYDGGYTKSIYIDSNYIDVINDLKKKNTNYFSIRKTAKQNRPNKYLKKKLSRHSVKKVDSNNSESDSKKTKKPKINT